MGCKIYDPFYNENVPNDNVTMFCYKNRCLMQRIHDLFGEYLLSYDKKSAHRRMMRSDLLTIFTALVQLNFHYSDRTIATGSLVYRFVKIYRKNILQKTHWFPTRSFNGTINKYQIKM